MAWPGITDFSEAVQNPNLCFEGLDLQDSEVSLNPRGMPLVYSGAFACVYRVSLDGTDYAVRCFTREVSDQQSRYNELSNYLISVLPPAFVHFGYQEQGIKIRGQWYPIVRMEWVEGETLNKFVEFNLQRPDALRMVAARWRGGALASLRGLGIAHNDLQHGNALVQADGRIRLVDYDGMFLPQFRGQSSPELGHKNYQHPKRDESDYDAYVDNFPGLVVYLSLLALAADANLWSFHNEDNLIFTNRDYANPASSDAFDALKGSSDQAVAKLAEKMEEFCRLSVDETPDLETILQDVPVTTPSGTTPAPAAPAARPPPAAPASRPVQAAPTFRPTSTAPASRPMRAAPAQQRRRTVQLNTQPGSYAAPPWPSTPPQGRPPPKKPSRVASALAVFSGAHGRWMKWTTISCLTLLFGLLLQTGPVTTLAEVAMILGGIWLMILYVIKIEYKLTGFKGTRPLYTRSGGVRKDILAAGIILFLVGIASMIGGGLVSVLWRPITFFSAISVAIFGIMDIIKTSERRRRRNVAIAIVVSLIVASLFLFLTPD